MTSHFTFFESYYDSVKDLDNDLKAEFFDTLFQYALYDVEPTSSANPVVKALFLMAKPNLDSSKAKREAGKQGGSKPKQTKANLSKPKQSESEKEKEKEKEKDIYKPFFLSDVQLGKVVDYRKKIKKPLKTDRGLKGIETSFKECIDNGYTFDSIFNIMQEKEWQSVKLDWIQKETKPTHQNITRKINPALGGYN